MSSRCALVLWSNDMIVDATTFMMDDEGRNEEGIVLGQMAVTTVITHCQVIGNGIPHEKFPLTHATPIAPGDRAVFQKGAIFFDWVPLTVESKPRVSSVSAWARLTELDT